MSREKLEDFLTGYAPASTTPNSIAYTTRDAAEDGFDPGVDDLGLDPGSQKPLLIIKDEDEAGASLVNDFLRYLMVEAPNYYKVKGGATSAQSLSHLDDSGNPVVLKNAEDTGAENVFVKTGESSGDGLGGTMSQYSNSGYLDGQDVTLSDIVSKWGNITPEADEGVGPHSGNRLLPSIQGKTLNKTGKTFVSSLEDDAAQNLMKATQKSMQSRNRFNVSDLKAYAPYDSTTLLSDLSSGEDGVGTRTAQELYGSFDKEGPLMINEDLANVARSMILKSLGLDGGSTPVESKDPNDYDYNDDSVWESASTMEGILSEKRLPRARDAYGAPSNTSGESPFSGNGAFELGSESTKSYGSSYTSDLMFDGTKNVAVIKARAAATILAILATSKGVAAQITEDYGHSIDLNRSPGFLGQAKRFAASAKTQIFQRLLIPHTRFKFDKCLAMGAKVLFGRTFAIEKSEIGGEKDEVASYLTVSQSPGFWHAVGNSMLKKIESETSIMSGMVESFTSDPAAQAAPILDSLARSGIVGFITTLIQIGDIALFSMGGNEDIEDAMTDGVRPFNVDLLAEGPQTRVSLSRVREGQTSSSLAWRGTSSPSMYLLPRSAIKAAVDLDNLTYGGNPLKGHTTNSLMMKTYIDIRNLKLDLASGRIPTDVRRRMEDTLDAEYVPFYFHDLRTNELIGFHAFIENLSDSYTANYSSTKGYGRIDAVQIYKDTSRSVNLSFYVAATSKEDFDEMWFKINKLTSLVYPKWSKGTTMIDDKDNSIIQPFSQVIAATPLVRLRVGDVIKSNYSRFNLGRIFGIGEPEFMIDNSTYGVFGGASGLANRSGINKIGIDLLGMSLSDIQMDTVFNVMFGSPLAISPFSGDAGAGALDRVANSLIASALTVNGFVNPIGAGMILQELRNPDSPEAAAESLMTSNNILNNIGNKARDLAGSTILNWDKDISVGYQYNSNPILKPSVNVGYIYKDTGGTLTRVRTTVPYVMKITGKSRNSMQSFSQAYSSPTSAGFNDANQVSNKLVYSVQFNDIDAPNLNGDFLVHHEDLMPNPDKIFGNRVAPYLDVLGWAAGKAQTWITDNVSKQLGLPADVMNVMTTDAAEFIHPGNNSITRAFENSGGRGLGGVIKSIQYNWVDSTMTWETDWGARAPKFCKITIALDVIHDIPPGLDSSGYNRAPIYNVGSTMNSIIGDPHPDHGIASKQSYTRAGVQSVQKLKSD